MLEVGYIMSIADLQHIEFLKQALWLAESQRGFCAPNPAVGALVVKDGNVIARGVHHGVGTVHAELDALQKLDVTQTQGADLYVTLEPCCHFGRTPPCTQCIIESGIASVFYGFQDPNPLVNGKGGRGLQAAGIVTHYLEVPEIVTFYRSYTYWTRTKRPWVIGKLAMSLDGKIAGPKGAPISITHADAMHYTHVRRQQSDALLSTVQTVLHDNPQLNIRLNKQSIKKNVYLLDSHLKFPLNARLIKMAKQIILLHLPCTDSKISDRRDILMAHGLRCFSIGAGQGGLDLHAALALIGKQGIQDLWIEAGAICLSSFFTQSLLNQLFIYIAPVILGQQALSAFAEPWSTLDAVKSVSWRICGNDIICQITC